MGIVCQVFLTPTARAGELVHLGEYLTRPRRSGEVRVHPLSAADVEGLRKGVAPAGRDQGRFFYLVAEEADPVAAGRVLCRFLRAFIPHPVIGIYPAVGVSDEG